MSGKVLKEFRGHSGAVNDASFSQDGTMIVTCGSEGAVKVWELKTSECLRTFTPPQSSMLTDCACNTASFLPRHRDQLLVSNRTGSLYIMSLAGEVCGCHLAMYRVRYHPLFVDTM